MYSRARKIGEGAIIRLKQPNKNSPKGWMRAVLKNGQGTEVTSCQRDLALHDFDLVYELMDEWCKEKSQEHNVPYHYCSLEDVKDEYAKYPEWFEGVDYSDINRMPKIINTQLSILSNRNYLKAEINRVINNPTTPDKLIENLEFGLAYIKELVAEQEKEKQQVDEATKLLANALYDTWKKTGIDMGDSITDASTKTLYYHLKDG